MSKSFGLAKIVIYDNIHCSNTNNILQNILNTDYTNNSSKKLKFSHTISIDENINYNNSAKKCKFSHSPSNNLALTTDKKIYNDSIKTLDDNKYIRC